MSEADDDGRSGADYEIWRVYEVGGTVLRLVVRYREDVEVPDWRNGPDVFAALQQGAADGWEVYDREPGDAPGEVMILHMRRRLTSRQ